MKTQTRKRKNHRRKTYKGGFKPGQNDCIKRPIEPFQQLYDQVDTKKYSRVFSKYRGTGCDLFIWVKKKEDPHIHIHGFTDNTFSYTITRLGVHNEQVELPAPTEEGYKYVLDEMCSQLTNGKHTSTSKLFYSPERTVSMVEPPKTNTKKSPKELGLASDIFKDVSTKLGPIMGEEMKKKETSLLAE
jgi:hypothetical protein